MDTYTVKKGEQLPEIARKLGIPIDSIIAINDFDDLELKEGQIIQIPVYDTTIFDVYKIKNGDTLYNVSSEYGISPNVLAAINGLDLTDYIYPGQKIIVPKQGISLYITGPGDTVRDVLTDGNLTLEDLVYYNGNVYLVPDQLLIHKDKEQI